MRKINPKYITSIAREVILDFCKYGTETPTIHPNVMNSARHQDAQEEINYILYLKRKLPEKLHVDLRAFLEGAITRKISPMVDSTLGKIIGFGLEKGGSCAKSFRKTPFHIYLQPQINPNGRMELEDRAAAVIAAAIWDFLEVYERAKKNDIGYSQAGQEYLEDRLTASRSFANGFVNTVVGTGP